MISASAKLTEVLEVLGRYAPDTPPKSRDFRKVLVLLQSYIYASVSASFFSNSSILFIANSSAVGLLKLMSSL